MKLTLTTIFFLTVCLDIYSQTIDNGVEKDWYYIDATGKTVIIGFDYNEGFHNNLASVRKNGKWGFVDTTGKLVVPLEYDLTNSFHDYLAPVKKKWIMGLY